MPTPIKRIHALDALRAIMMLLGIVLHSTITYCVYNQKATWPLADANAQHISMDLIMGYIHLFRMPIFFIVAGFFGALLFYERSAIIMLKNRINRVVWPFVVFAIILWPIIGSIFLFSYTAMTGEILPESTQAFSLTRLIPTKIFHLWFLYYLIMISAFAFCIGLITNKKTIFKKRIRKMMHGLLVYPFLKIIFSTIAVFAILLLMNQTWVGTNITFVPDWKIFLFYCFFYLFGWFLFLERQYLETFKQYDWLYFFSSIVLFTAAFFLQSSLSFFVQAFLNALIVVSAFYGIIGLFIRYFSQPSNKMRYLSDASYWVYLVHLPFTLLGPGLLVNYELPAVIKALIVILITTFITFTSYHFCVRSTFIGKFLNGKKYP